MYRTNVLTTVADRYFGYSEHFQTEMFKTGFSMRRWNVLGTLAASKIWFCTEPRHLPLECLLEQFFFIGCQFKQR